MMVGCACRQHGPMHDENIVREGIAALEEQQPRAKQRQRNNERKQRQRPAQQPRSQSMGGQDQTDQTVHSPKTRHGNASQKKLRGLFGTLEGELVPNAGALFLTTHGMAHVLGCTPPPLEMMRNALRQAGYSVGGSHTHPLAIITDAPQSFQWDVMRAWVASMRGRGKEPRCASQPQSAGHAILQGGRTTSLDRQATAIGGEATSSGGTIEDRIDRVVLEDVSHSGR
jgi:hypothetical protein